MDVNPKEVGERIRSIRKNLGVSMDEFASRIDEKAKSGTVSNWETGKNLPNNERLKRIAELGNVTVSFLLHGSATEFLVTNLKNLFPSDYSFLAPVISSDWVFNLAKILKERNISAFETEKIKSIIIDNLPDIILDFEEYHNKLLDFILKHKEYKQQAIDYFSSVNSSFDKEEIDKIEYIYENAKALSLEEISLLSSNIEDLHSFLDTIIKNVPLFTYSNAYLLDENSLLTGLNKIDFENNELEDFEVHYKEIIKPYPHTFKHYHLLIDIKSNDITQTVGEGDHLLIHYFPDLTLDLIKKYFINNKMVIIYDDKLYIGLIDENLIFKSRKDKEINLNNIEIRDNIFPLLSILY